jgi:DNA-directed RNA polymerase specialized sigma24 family protein
MSEATKLAGAASSADPDVGLRAVASLRVLLESLERLQVESARAQGWSWQQVADALGVSRQAVHKKHRRA